MIINETQLIDIILIKYHETNSVVMGYNEYKKKWDAVIGEVLEAHMESTKDIHEYADDKRLRTPCLLQFY